jgi:hypothetical protein
MIIVLGIIIICISLLVVSIIKMFQMQNELFEIEQKTILQILEKTKKN